MKLKLCSIAALLLAASTLIVACDSVELGGLLGEMMEQQTQAQTQIEVADDIVSDAPGYATDAPLTEDDSGTKATSGLKFSTEGCAPGTCKVTGTGSANGKASIIIPSKSPNGDTVVAIGDEAFRESERLSSVVIPDSVTSIGRKAFYHCPNLQKVEMSDHIISIGAMAFYDCDSLTTILLPEGLTTIESGTFSLCSGLLCIRIPNQVQLVNTDAFFGCSNLKEVFYTGSEQEWASIDFSNNTWVLNSATIYFDYVPQE